MIRHLLSNFFWLSCQLLLFILLLTLLLPVALFAQPASEQYITFNGRHITLDGEFVPIGSTVAAYDSDGILCGEVQVTIAGQYGPLLCRLDDPNTAQDEGVEANDRVLFRVNGYAVDSIRMVGDVPNGPPLPPNVIPEPLTIILFGAGLTGLSGLIRLRRTRK